MNVVIVSVKMPASLVEKIDEIAAEEERSRSYVIRRLIMEHSIERESRRNRKQKALTVKATK